MFCIGQMVHEWHSRVQLSRVNLSTEHFTTIPRIYMRIGVRWRFGFWAYGAICFWSEGVEHRG
jgi:hypothetical protein